MSKQRIKSDKRTIKMMAARYDESELSELQNIMFENYKQDFPEEQYCQENPYLQHDDDNSTA